MQTRHLKSDLLFLLSAIIWGFAFVAQRMGMDHVGPFTFNGIRFFLGAMVLVPFIYRSQKNQPRTYAGNRQTPARRLIFYGGLAGLAIFAGASLQQVASMSMTRIWSSRRAMVSARGKEAQAAFAVALALVFADGEYYEARFFPDELIGRSGRGDTCIAAYTAKRLTAPPDEATIWAAAVTSLKMEAEGPFRRDMGEVEDLIHRKYRG